MSEFLSYICCPDNVVEALLASPLQTIVDDFQALENALPGDRTMAIDGNWDPLARILGNGSLSPEANDPIAECIFGQVRVYPPRCVYLAGVSSPAVARLHRDLSRTSIEEMKENYFRLSRSVLGWRLSSYDGPVTTEDWEATLGAFEMLVEFLSRASSLRHGIAICQSG